MAMIRWYEPSRSQASGELNRFQDEMNRLFTNFFGAVGPQARAGVFPALNVSEKGDDVIVRGELPGIKTDDMEISVEGDTLTLKGERKLTEAGEGVSYHRRERESGRFRRILTLPARINADAVTATFKNGILEIILPKAEEAKPKQISIKT